MNCRYEIAGLCKQALDYKKYAEERKCQKCCRNCKTKCDYFCNKTKEEIK